MIIIETYRIEQVAAEVGVSTQTINNWYKFKRENPRTQLARQLPKFVKSKITGTRYWSAEDIEKLKEFKENKPSGRNGRMASVTQRYVKKEK